MKKKNNKNKRMIRKEEVITLDELAVFLGTHKRIIERLIMLEVIEPISAEPEYYFSIELLPVMKKIMRLHYDLGVGWSSMGLVLDLLNRIEELESRLKGE